MSNINKTIQNKTAYITGGNFGIGEATSKYLASTGLNVIIFGRSSENGKRVEEEINKLEGGRALFVQGDVTSEEDQRKALEEGEKKFGAIHYVFANAGVIVNTGGIFDTPLNDWKKVFEVNFFGSLITFQQIGPYFKKNGGGVIVFNSSVGGVLPRSFLIEQGGFESYSLTKTTIDGLVKLATSLDKSNNIKAYSVNPTAYKSGLTNTSGISQDIIAQNYNILIKKLGNPNDLGKVIEHLFDGTTKYLSGTGILCENEYTWSTQYFYNKYLTEENLDLNELINEYLSDSRGEKLSKENIVRVHNQIKEINEKSQNKN
eukprot:TRINITY_DN240_c0_g2_i1.p1 TRINITY_DN240_c0_g2~~TRINITY_DN240_c0_g2_i1.p1  ORF type:complete len:317 (-),score=97.43 TRINITY_DN240_c0_g2_i1:58-1008(-)